MKSAAFNPYIGMFPDGPIDKICHYRDGLPAEDAKRVEQQLREAWDIDGRRREMGVRFIRGPLAGETGQIVQTAQQVYDLIAKEQGTMMVEPVSVFETALHEPYTVLVSSRNDPNLVVGFATLFRLTDEWYELRSLVVRNHEPNSFRNRGIATEIVFEVLRLGFYHLPECAGIIATVKDDYAITALVRGGMGLERYSKLPPEVRLATCTCTGPGEGGIGCPKAGTACRLAVLRKK